MLTLPEHNAWANSFAASLSLPDLSPQAPERPVPKLLLDPAESDTLKLWQSNAAPVTDVVRAVKSTSGSGVMLCGQGSAGVDIPFLSGVCVSALWHSGTLALSASSAHSLSRARSPTHIATLSGVAGERLHAEVRFRLVPFPQNNSVDAVVVDASTDAHTSAVLGDHEAEAEPEAAAAAEAVVIVTLGDSRRHAQLAVVDRQLVLVSTATNTTTALLASPVLLKSMCLFDLGTHLPQSFGKEAHSSAQVLVGSWHVANITVEPTTGLMSVSVDGGGVVTPTPLPLQSVWMYVGQGYRTLNGTSRQPKACAEIDLTAMNVVVRS
jgi:hypothetical protein